MKADLRAFLMGYKPALLYKKDPQLMKYPHVSNIDMFDGSELHLFFQSKESKRIYENRMKNVVPRSPEFHYVLGLTLGYPPRAVEFYVKRVECKQQGRRNELKHLESKIVGLHYTGIRCSSNVDDLEENIRWLWDRYKVDESLYIRVETKMIPISFRNMDKVKQIQLSIRQMERVFSPEIIETISEK